MFLPAPFFDPAAFDELLDDLDGEDELLLDELLLYELLLDELLLGELLLARLWDDELLDEPGALDDDAGLRDGELFDDPELLDEWERSKEKLLALLVKLKEDDFDEEWDSDSFLPTFEGFSWEWLSFLSPLDEKLSFLSPLDEKLSFLSPFWGLPKAEKF